MKTVSISFLLLVAFPIHLLAQESSQSADDSAVQPKYFVYSPTIIKSGSNHITEPSNTSNRKSATNEFKLPELTNTFKTVPLNLDIKPAPDVVRVASLQTVSEIVQEQVIETPSVPTNDFKPLGNVTRPTPDNTNPIIPQQPAPVASPETVERNYQDVFRQDAGSMPERVSLDDIQMAQRGNSWDKKPSTMRDIVDNFSPGGEPFARRGIVGTPNFFGVDRNSCCDEWEGHCNCSGGLKGNPGHLGNPFLRSKDNCDARKKVLGKHRGCKTCQPENTCGCPQCAN